MHQQLLPSHQQLPKVFCSPHTRTTVVDQCSTALDTLRRSRNFCITAHPKLHDNYCYWSPKPIFVSFHIMSLLIVVACYYHTSVTHTNGDNFLVCFTDFTNNDDSEELRGCTGCAGCARIDRIYFNIIRASHAAVRPCVRVFLMTICSQCRSLGCVPDSADEAFEANVCFFTM